MIVQGGEGAKEREHDEPGEKKIVAFLKWSSAYNYWVIFYCLAYNHTCTMNLV